MIVTRSRNSSGKPRRLPFVMLAEGLLKPATISFGQAMPVRETEEAYNRSSRSDLFIVIGSSLVVEPAASMPRIAKRSGAKLVIINRDPTPYDDYGRRSHSRLGRPHDGQNSGTSEKRLG